MYEISIKLLVHFLQQTNLPIINRNIIDSKLILDYSSNVHGRKGKWKKMVTRFRFHEQASRLLFFYFFVPDREREELAHRADNVSENVAEVSISGSETLHAGKKVAKAPLSLRLPLLGNHRAKFRNRIS